MSAWRFFNLYSSMWMRRVRCSRFAARLPKKIDRAATAASAATPIQMRSMTVV
jgi:hypothetical protein